MQNLSNQKEKIVLLLILLMAPIAGTGIDLYAPSMPLISKLFNTTSFYVKLTIPLYLIGYGSGQFIFGTLSDIFGRKPLLLSGLISFSITSFIISHVNSIYIFWIFRFIQGLFVAAPGAIGKAMLADNFKGKSLQKASTYWVLIWATSPVLAPALGSIITHIYGWHMNFTILSVYTFFVFLIYSANLQESNNYKSKFSFKTIIENYIIVLKNKVFLGGAICLAITYAMLITFNILAPFIIQNVLGYSIIYYGNIALLVGAGFLIGTLLNRLLIIKYNPNNIIKFSISLMIMLSLTMFLSELIIINVYVIAIFSCVIILLSALVTPNCYSICLKLYPDRAGSSSAIMGAFTMIGAALLSIIPNAIKNSGFSHSIGLIYFILSFLCFIIVMLLIIPGTYDK